MPGGKKNKYSLDIGEAQVKPSYAVDVGEAKIRPQSGYGVDIGEAEIKQAMSPQDDLDAELDSVLAEDSDPSLDAELDSVLAEDSAPTEQTVHTPQRQPSQDSGSDDVLSTFYNLTKVPRAVGMALTQGPLQQYGDEAAAALESLANMGRSKLLENDIILDPGIFGHAEVTGRGIDAPLAGTSDYLPKQRALHRQAEEESPMAYNAANMGSDMASSLLVPQIKGVRGAQLGNVAVDALMGGTAAMGAADGADPTEAALTGAGVGAGVSGTLRGIPAAARGAMRGLGTVADAARELQTSSYPQSAREAAIDLTSRTPEGAKLRASAARGAEGADTAIRDVTSALSETEDLMDQVLDYAKVGLKKAPVAKGMAAEGLGDIEPVVLAQADVVSDVASNVEKLLEESAERTPVGRSALRSLRDAVDAYHGRVGDIAESGPDAAAEIFVRLDNLKRAVGRSVKAAGRGRNPDNVAEESLMGVYEELRSFLENPQIWGNQAATMQTEINAAWTPWLSQRQGFSKRFLVDDTGLRGSNKFRNRPEADPGKVAPKMRAAGTVENELNERMLREGVGSSAELADSLTRYYNAPPEIMSAAERVRANSQRVGKTLDSTIADMSAARQMEELQSASRQDQGLRQWIPSPATQAQLMTRAERAVDRTPALMAPVRGVKAAGATMEAGARPAAVMSSVALAPQPRQESSPGSPEEALAALQQNPDAFGSYGAIIEQAAREGDMETFQLALLAASKEQSK